MKRSLLATTALLLITSFAAPLQAQTVTQAGESWEVAQQRTLSRNNSAVRVLYDYFDAIASRNYQLAYNLHSPEFRAQVSYDEFVQMYQNHIGSIRIQSVEPLPSYSNPNHQEFRLEFNASYLKPYPAGNGRFPEFFVLVPAGNAEGEWLIDGMAPGP
jgi:hypothetical protein